MLDYDLEHIFSYNVTLHPPEVIGPVPEGARANFYVSDGEATGPKVHGMDSIPWAGTGSSFAPTG